MKNEDIREPIRISPPSAWVLFSTLAGIMLSALVIVAIVKIDIQILSNGRIFSLFDNDLRQERTAVVAKTAPVMLTLFVHSSLTEKDRRFIKPGDLVSIELKSYPITEFGGLKGRITQIGPDLIVARDGDEILAEKNDAYKAYPVQIELLPERPLRLSQLKLLPGTQVLVRFTLCRQRLIVHLLQSFH